MVDTTRRSIAKTISWRLVGSSAVLLISFLLTGSFALASSIAIIQLVSNTILYFIHERLWSKIQWGITLK
jgi:uncharacterized membrane protein